MKNIRIMCDQCGIEINHSNGICGECISRWGPDALPLAYRFGNGIGNAPIHWCSLNCTMKFLEVKLTQMRKESKTK